MSSTAVLPSRFLDLGIRLAAFSATHKRLPSQCKAPDLDERELGEFLRIQRDHVRRPSLMIDEHLAARLAWLDEHVPAWRTQSTRTPSKRRRAVSFEARVRAVRRFVRQHGTFPSSSSSKLRERRLGLFLTNQRQAAKGRGTTAWSDQRKFILDTKVPGWDAPLTQRPAVVGFA